MSIAKTVSDLEKSLTKVLRQKIKDKNPHECGLEDFYIDDSTYLWFCYGPPRVSFMFSGKDATGKTLYCNALKKLTDENSIDVFLEGEKKAIKMIQSL